MSQECHSLLLPQEGRWAAQVATLSCDFRSGHVIPEHFHPEDQLVFASRGVMTVRTKQGIWVVPPLRAVWIPARTPHSITVSGAVSMRTMYFLPKLITVGRGECLVLNVSPLLRELILHACDFPRLKKAVPAQGRIIAMIADQLATARCWSQSHGRGLGCGLQQHQRIYRNVQEAVGHNAYPLLRKLTAELDA